MDYTVRTIHEYSYTQQANKILINTHVRVTSFLPFSNVYTIKSIREEENKKMFLKKTYIPGKWNMTYNITYNITKYRYTHIYCNEFVMLYVML